jgi:hypothetical protein
MQAIMQELLQQIDLDYYRSARLPMVHADLEHLRQERPADIERQRDPRIDSGSGDVGLVTARELPCAE